MAEYIPTIDELINGFSEKEEPSPVRENNPEKILKKTENEIKQAVGVYNEIIDTSVGISKRAVSVTTNAAAAEALKKLRDGSYNVNKVERIKDVVAKEDPPEEEFKTWNNFKDTSEKSFVGISGKVIKPPSPKTHKGLPAIRVRPLTPEEELFVKCFAETENPGRAYERAFPFSSPKCGIYNAGKDLLTQEHIRYHISLRRLNIITEADISVSSLLAELEDARLMAMEDKKPAVAIAATMAKAKLTGLDRTTVEVTGKNGAAIEFNSSTLPPEDICRRIAFVMNSGQIAATRSIGQLDIKETTFTEVKE